MKRIRSAFCVGPPANLQALSSLPRQAGYPLQSSNLKTHYGSASARPAPYSPSSIANGRTANLIIAALLLAVLAPTAVLPTPRALGRTGARSKDRDGSRMAWGESPMAAGDLDPTFGVNGWQTTDFFSFEDWAYGVAIQPDGKIVVAGRVLRSTDSQTADFGVARYGTDGMLDQSFGTGGKQTTDFFGAYDQASGVAIQADGKIVVAGYSTRGVAASEDFALARYNPNGILDQSFGSGGKQTTDFFGFRDQAQALAIQQDGKIVLAGFAFHASGAVDFAVARYNTDGTPDQSFGSGGKQTTSYFGTDAAFAVAIQADGKILAAGYSLAKDASTYNFGLARYNLDGALDQSFGSGGKQTTDFFGQEDFANAIAIQADGKIVAGGYTRHPNSPITSDFALARYNADGSLDQSFGSGGKQSTDFFGRSDQVNALAVQSDGKIVAAGNAVDSDDTLNVEFGLARYNLDGTLDQGFGAGGKQSTDFFDGTDAAYGVAFEPDGKIVVAGLATHIINDQPSGEFAVARYGPGILPPDFSIAFNPGSVTTHAGSKVGATLTINRIGGFNGNVTVTPPQPAGGIKPKPPDPATLSGDTAVFKLKVGGGVSPGSYSRTFTAKDDSGRTHTASLTIVVQ